jgi:hypothetical protein
MPPTMVTYFTFSEFNGGVRATPEQFRSELATFKCGPVIYLCGVMNSMLRDWQGHTDTEAHDVFVRNSFPPELANRILSECHNPQRPRGLYHRQQLLFVCKEAVLACPESGGKDPVALPFGGGIGKVLLMANDLLPKRVTGPAPTAEQMINVLSEFIPIAEASGFNKAVHKIVRSHLMLDHYPNNGKVEIEKVFKQGTGISLDDYLALCFATLCRYSNLDYKQYVANPSAFVLTQDWYRTTPLPPQAFSMFLNEISATPSELRTLLERKKYASSDFTCFKSKPLLRDGENHFLIDPIFLAAKGESGTFWRINEALSGPARLRFHADWGLDFEGYINWLMTESVDGAKNHCHPNPKFTDTGEEVCDAIVVCGNSAVFIESKGATFTAEAKYGSDTSKLKKEIDEKFIHDGEREVGIGQLALRIMGAFDSKLPRRIEGLDLSRVDKVFPVLVTRDDVGAALVMNAYLACRFRELFRRKAASATVTPPFSLSAQDVEMICGYLKDASFADLLEERYRNERNLLSTFWAVGNAVVDRIGHRECKPFADALHDYFQKVETVLFPHERDSGP